VLTSFQEQQYGKVLPFPSINPCNQFADMLEKKRGEGGAEQMG